MTEKEQISLKPISKKEVEKLKEMSGRAVYVPLIRKFLESNDDAVELIIPQDIPHRRPYQALLRYAKNHDFPFVVRQRQKRIFLLKVNKKGEVTR